MGKVIDLKRKKKLTTPVKIIDPQPIWVATIETESGKTIKRFMNINEAEIYMKAGHPVKLVTNAGELQQY